MGNTTIRTPNTIKTLSDDTNGIINFGKCEMQGWRNTMVIIMNFNC